MISELRRLWKLAFGDTDAFLDSFFATAYSPDRCRFLTDNGQVTAALYWFDCQCGGQKFAYLYAVATHPDFRGRGLCRTLMADTQALLKQRGYSGVLLVPQEEPLRRMYEKMGYRNATRVSEIFSAAGKPVAIRPVDGAEYSRLRRRYLPEGGVIQEGENLRFLEKTVRLYAGEDFLLADGMELLGSAEKAPGILAALGRPEGTFRIPGEEIPFAMFLPLTADAVCPRYFGLAFD